jgi:hypothetical protein
MIGVARRESGSGGMKMVLPEEGEGVEEWTEFENRVLSSKRGQ